MAMENYVPVMVRVAKAIQDHKESKQKFVIETSYEINWEKEAVIFKAVIKVDDQLVAVGHGMAPSLGDDKEFEKAETVAVGRALQFLGYEADDGAGDSDDKPARSEKKSGKGGGLGGLGKKSKSKDDDEKEEKEEKSSKKSESKKSKDEEEETEETEEESEEGSEEEEESGDADEEKEEKQEKKSSPATAGKLSGVMAKYGLGGKK